MKLHFLEATNGLPLSKSYTGKSVTPYPLVKAVNSHEEDITLDQAGLEDLEQLIQTYGAKGHCLLKGNLKKALVEESRAGHIGKTTLSSLLVLDIDGVRLPKPLDYSRKLKKDDVSFLARQVLNELPVELHDVSYIAQASSSLGLKGDAISLHIFMLLEVPMPPKSIKLWLQDANFESDTYSEQMDLSVNGQSLTYPLDISVADNSKIIFISPPTFSDPNQNPFEDDDERIVLVKRERATFDLGQLIGNLSPQKTFEKGQGAKDRLREERGFKKKNSKLKMTSLGNEPVEILTNPDKMSISFVDTGNFPFVRCNVNGGDSGAYYFYADNPIYMFNFKGEPIFEIEKADAEFFAAIPETFQEKLKEIGKAETAMVMRDFDTDTIYAGMFDPNTDQFSDEFPLTPITKQNVEGFLNSHGKVLPEFIPDGRVVFDPASDDPAVNLKKIPYYINTFRKTKYALNPTEPSVDIEFGSAKYLKELTPLCYQIMYHMLGNGDEEFERFINWLAFIYQNRQKTGVAWVLSGVQGTGKGIFYTRILRGLFGLHHAPMRYLRNMEEQFNLYMRDALFLVVDEFHMASASAGIRKMADQLKTQITERTITIRAMRSNQLEIPNYTNFIFLTNRADAVSIEPGDRRYNIAPSQENKLLDTFDDISDKIDSNQIEKELWHLAGVLAAFNVDRRLATTPVDNSAKRVMRSVSMSVFEEFSEAVKVGNLTFFTDILDINTTTVLNSGDIDTAQRIVKAWIADQANDYAVIPMEHLRTVYHVQTEQNPRYSIKDFTKRMSRNGLSPERKRPFNAGRDANPIRGVVVDWQLTPNEQTHLIDTYFTHDDQRLISTV